MRKFDTKVQLLKYKVLREVARYAWSDQLLEKIVDIPGVIVPARKSDRQMPPMSLISPIYTVNLPPYSPRLRMQAAAIMAPM